MNMNVDYFDNRIEISSNCVNAIEIENKRCFCRFIYDLRNLVLEGYSNSIKFFDEGFIEKNMTDRIKIFIDFFDLGFDTKKCLNDVSRYVIENIDEEHKNDLINEYDKITKIYKKILNDMDMSLSIGTELNLQNITKCLKISINESNQMLENFLSLIDLEKNLHPNSMLVFVNLKQYLSKDELLELYKYAIYNQVLLLLVDSQSYGITLEYEKKLIIDENLDEFVL